jgi:hypothetical protein
MEHQTCVLILYTTSVRNISHSEKNLPRYDQKCTLVFRYSRVSAILVTFNDNSICSRQISEIIEI